MNKFRLTDEIIHDTEITTCTPDTKKDVVMANTVFTNVKVRNFEIGSIKAVTCNFNNCDLNFVYILGGTITRCTFFDVRFSHVVTIGVRFEDCVFERCFFGHVPVGHNQFVNCRFWYCDLPKGDVSVSFFSGTSIDRSNTFSQCTGWPSPSEFLAQNFERNETNTGYIVYKTFGSMYSSPHEWLIAPGSIITENCDLNRGDTCSYGINVATIKWIRDNIDGADGSILPDLNSPAVWRCEILDEWLADVCVPIGSDGKIRCGKLRLIETI